MKTSDVTIKQKNILIKVGNVIYVNKCCKEGTIL